MLSILSDLATRAVQQEEAEESPKLELHKWWSAVNSLVPAQALDISQPLSSSFKRIPHVRHVAVHSSVEIPVTSLDQMLRDTISITKGLRDEERSTELSNWRRQISILIPNIEFSQEQTTAVSQLQASRNTISDLENWKVELDKRLSEERVKEKRFISEVAS